MLLSASNTPVVVPTNNSTLRHNTERPETVDVGANILAGTDPKRIQEAVRTMMNRPRGDWKNPFGDGTAGERIVRLCERGVNGQIRDEND